MDICIGNIYIDKDRTLMRFTMAEVSVRHWCATRGFGKSRFYEVVNNTTLKRRDCLQAIKIIQALKKEGLLVLAEKDDTLHAA